MPEHSRRAFADAQRRGDVTEIAPSLQLEVDEPSPAACDPFNGTKQIVELVVRPPLRMTAGGLDLQPRSYRSPFG
jgi:hypothetical protein